MDDHKEIELTWRKEFDESGEEGVREKLFRGTFLANQRKEAFAFRWLGEKGEAEERTNRRRWRNIRSALKILVVLVVVATVIINWFPGLIPFLFLEK
jgi:hypothetical protein